VAELEGLPDGVLVPDVRTFRMAPWSSAMGVVICDLRLRSGSALPFCTRQLLRGRLDELAASGLEYRVGLEIELYVTRIVDDRLDWAASSRRPPAAPVVAPVVHGDRYHGEQAFDPMDVVVTLVRETAEGLELPLATVEMETGPGHLECTFDVLDAASAADAMLLFRSGVKQAVRRAGYHASFMPRPHLDGVEPSGWHLHRASRMASPPRLAGFSAACSRTPTSLHFSSRRLSTATNATSRARSRRPRLAGRGIPGAPSSGCLPAPTRIGRGSSSGAATLRLTPTCTSLRS